MHSLSNRTGRGRSGRKLPRKLSSFQEAIVIGLLLAAGMVLQGLVLSGGLPV